MARLIGAPAQVAAAGNMPKRIEEFVGLVNTGTDDVSIARMLAPAGWEQPGQTPEFDEYILVLSGTLRVETRGEAFDVGAGQAVAAPRRTWVRFSTPYDGGAEMIAVCTPAFSPARVHRDA